MQHSRLANLVREFLQAVFRLLPWPTATGLRRVGSPDSESPVIVTANYDLTVRRLMHALRELDAWVVVAPSSGINVWCAASGGHLTTHQVVTALKTSGIEEHVSQRRAILPQLCATGVIGRDVARRCGWKVRFGPVYAEDIPRYLAAKGKKTDEMRHVHFGPVERVEMAASLGGPMALLVGGLAAWLAPDWWLPLVGLVLALSLVVFFGYERVPEPSRLIVGAAATVVVLLVVILAEGGVGALATAGVTTALIVGVLTYDYTGATPTAGGSHFEEKAWHITLDAERCKGIYACWEVCPEACFEKREGVREIELAHEERCIRCGACIVQCPEDALYFEDGAGRKIEPDVIRRFKLNLMGQRSIDAGENDATVSAT